MPPGILALPVTFKLFTVNNPATVPFPTMVELLAVKFVAVKFCNTVLPPTYKLPPMPTPPATVNAPVAVEVACVGLETVIALVVVAPRPVIVCSVDVFQTTTTPVVVDTAVSVPAVSVLTP